MEEAEDEPGVMDPAAQPASRPARVQRAKYGRIALMAGELNMGARSEGSEPVRHPDRHHRVDVVFGRIFLDVALFPVEEDLERFAG